MRSNFSIPISLTQDIDLDTALVKVIPQVKAARTPGQYGQAIGDLLQALNDPATIVGNLLSFEQCPPSSSSSGKKRAGVFSGC